MPADRNQMSDEVIPHLTREGEDGPPPLEAPDQNPPIPDRPADGATKGKWVDYVVALGMDRAGAESVHEEYDDLGQPVAESKRARTRDELADLATYLGG